MNAACNQPDRVTIESLDGNILQTWHNPHQSFRHYTKSALFDELHLVFLCCFSIWSYLATPFLLDQHDVKIEELTPWYEQGQQWRRLRAILPPSFVTHSHEQMFYFDAAGLQRRTDHELFGMRVADYSWAHQEFGGIVVPTLRRSLSLEDDGTVIEKPSLIEVDIFDVAFE